MMEKNHALTFLLGAVIGGTAAYYAYKHQDEILEGIKDLEGSLNLDNNELIEKTKAQFNQLSDNVQNAIGRYTNSSDDSATRNEDEIAVLMEEIERLRLEVQTLKS
jgi:polyhydroxyalkanoate synthesis regulator phasin